MKTKTSIAWIGAGVVSLLAFASPNLVEANHYLRHKKHDKAARQEIRGDWAEIHKDRAELRRDIDELYRDRVDLRRAIRRGASPEEIARREGEIRQDIGEIRGDRRELQDDYAELRRDREKFGWNNNDNHGRYGYPRYSNYGSWNRDRWGWDRNRLGWD